MYGSPASVRTSDGATTAIYLLILAAAVVRVAAPFLVDWTLILLAVSAALWALAFAGFVAAYGPMLCRRSL